MNTALIAGRYRLQEKIGEGGMAVVYRAIDVSLGREVAVKILREEFAADPAFVQRFRREAHAAARLQHPNIIQIYDTGVQDETYYIVMEYVREPNLKRILGEYAPLPLRKALEVGIQVGEAIEYAHNNDIVHRDIKPQNILFTDDGRAKVADFGIASAVAATSPSDVGVILGSAHYISPEQVQGHPASPQSDLYSLGAVLYEALTGRPPFEGDSAAEIAAYQARERPKSPRALNANVTPSTEYVVMKALSKDLSRRYRSAAEMLHDLRKLQEGVRLEHTGILPMPEEHTAVAPEPVPEPLSTPSSIAAPTEALAGLRIRPVAVEDEGPPLRTAVAVGAALLVALLVAGFAAWRVMYPNPPPARVQVPRVVGKTRADAITILAQANLALGKETTQTDETRQPGTIIDQSPGFGEFVDEKTTVDIVIATSEGTAIVPDVVRQTPEDADAMLKRRELVLGNVVLRYDDTTPAGRIIEQDVQPGTNQPKGEAVNVVVSRGPPPEEGTIEPGDDENDLGAAGDGVSSDQRPEEPMESAPVVSFTPGPSWVDVQVVVGGRQQRRHIKIVKTDEEVRGLRVLEKSVDPGAGLNKRVDVEGSATIQVYVDNELEHEYRLEPTAADVAPAVPEGRDTP